MRKLYSLSMALLLLGLTSCGDSGPKLYPVSGKVDYNGQNIKGGAVTFIPMEGSESKYNASGEIQEDGSFTLSTYIDRDNNREGAPAGKYKVTVTWYGEGGGRGTFTPSNELPSQYASADETPLEAEVKPEDNNLRPFELYNE